MKIKNYKNLATSPLRIKALEIAEAGLAAIDTQAVVKNSVRIFASKLQVLDSEFPLARDQRIFVVGVGKCAIDAAIALEQILGKRLRGGLIIDIRPTRRLKKIKAYQGFHPVPQQRNVDATKKLVRLLKSLGEKDLVICIVSGGGSTMLCSPEDLSCMEEGMILRHLSAAGADIRKINTVRKHISYARGGFLAKYAYPAAVVSLIFSDVVGNDLDYVASGPTFKDTTTVLQAEQILAEYDVLKKCGIEGCGLIETPKEGKYFKKVHNILLVNNTHALQAMAQKAKVLGFKSKICSSCLEGEAREVGQAIAEKFAVAPPGTAWFYGGETTVSYKSTAGKGGRNQELVLAGLLAIKKNEILAAFNTDGWDNTEYAGALCDILTEAKVRAKRLDSQKYLAEHNSFEFFKKTGDHLLTGRLGSNVSDLVVALKA